MGTRHRVLPDGRVVQVSADPAPLPPGTVLYHCPLCEWAHAEHPVSETELIASLGDPVLDLALRRAMAVEVQVASHLSTHPLTEWVREVARLREELDKSRTATWRTGSGAILLAAILLRRLGGEAFISDAEQVSEGGLLSQMPERDGFRIWVSAK